MKQVIFIFSLFLSVSLFAQVGQNPSRAIYKSSNGTTLPTKGVFRGLTIFVSIIYDQNDTISQYTHGSSQYWQQDVTNSINSPLYRPTYMLDLFDVNALNPLNPQYNGVVTRLFAESSFNQLVLLSDFMVVNIRQSQITPNNPKADFTGGVLRDSVIAYINKNGGLNAIYNHNSILDYDNMKSSSTGLEKPLVPDNNIDFINFLTMNTIKNKNVNYGDANWGGGNSSAYPGKKIKIGNSEHGYNTGTYQCIGSGGDVTHYKKSILTHEFAHYFLGGNEFHTSGGTTNNDTYHNTFIGKQYGFGLFDGGLLTCNAYERLRLGWQSSSNNSYPIAANGVNSDIVTQFSGEQTFTLRDFVTYGDAIRIKLPYKDSGNASNQYIWLENHQVGKNNKQDGFRYSETNTCRDVNKAGIYAYHQVGKDILENTVDSIVFSRIEKDNLRIISAEGNYNVTYLGNEEDCLIWTDGYGREKFIYNNQNTFLGVNNQTEVLSYNTQNLKLIYPDDYRAMGSKIKNGIFYNNLPWEGDNFDAFVPNSEIKMDISTNPSPVNVLTYYNTKRDTMSVINTNRNTRKIYLTGLSIKMIDPNPGSTSMKAYTVKIRWDDYDVKQDVSWTGDIVLKEQLNLLAGKIITLEQNLTPIQVEKDPVSNFFAPPTLFTCKNNSQMNLSANSQIILKDKSSLVLESGASLSIQDNAQIIVKSGSTLMLKSNSSLQIVGKGRIIIESGGYLCVENGANINLQAVSSVIRLLNGAILGANPALFNNSNCISNITSIQTTGNGAICNQSTSVNIQNQTVNTNTTVTTPCDINVQDVTVTNNSKLKLETPGEVTITSGFEVKAGSELQIK